MLIRRSGVRCGDELRDGRRRVRFVTTADGRYFRLDAAVVALLELFGRGGTVEQVAADNDLPRPVVRPAVAGLVRAGLIVPVSDDTAPERAVDGEPRGIRVVRNGAAGRLIFGNPGRVLQRAVPRGATLTALVGLLLAGVVVSLSVSAVRFGEMVDATFGGHGLLGWAVIVAATVIGTGLHELGHAIASIAVGGDASEIGFRWWGPFGSFYTRTDQIRVVRGRGRRAAITLAGPAVGFAIAAPFALWWVLAGGWVPAAITGALVLSTAVNLVPVPPMDGYTTLQHLTGYVDLAGQGMRALRGTREERSAARFPVVYVLLLTLFSVGVAGGVVTVWFITLRMFWGPWWAAAALLAEAAVIAGCVAAYRRHRSSIMARTVVELAPARMNRRVSSATATDRRRNSGEQMTTAIGCDGLTKRFEGDVGVFDVSLQVRAGTIHGLVGPNGAGKTTLMRMILGLVRPTSGTVTLLGAPSGTAAAMSGVGALIETPMLYPGLSGRVNLRALARYAGRSEADVDRALDTVGLSDQADRRFGSYSLGMKQRLGLGAALLKDPALLVLDEPTNGLDPVGMADMRALLLALRRKGCTVLLSSHQLQDVEALCDDITMLHRGRLVPAEQVNRSSQQRAAREYVVEADDAGRLVAALRDCDAVLDVTPDDDVVRACLAPHDAAAVLRQLVLGGVLVSRFTPTDDDLNRTFLRIVGDHQEPERSEAIGENR